MSARNSRGAATGLSRKPDGSADMDNSIYAVIGRPVMHSLSPRMHNAAFDELGIGARYIRLASADPKSALRTLKAMGARGFNATAPYKEDMLELVDTLGAEAAQIGAVNTVCVTGGRLAGHNTDSCGVVQALRNCSVALKGESVLVIGAGGAARAAAHGLLASGARVTVANRTPAKAKAVARDLGCSGSSLAKGEMEKALASCGAIISCTSTSDSVVPRKSLRKGLAVLDANYRRETALVRDARKAGCKVIDGREWLLYQGAKAFELFTGEDAPLATMRKAVYSNPGAKWGKGISLIGFMGAGKSRVAKSLAKKLVLPAIDTDADIERESGMTINEIFRRRGEAGFRELERKRIYHLPKGKPSVVASGGGSVLDKKNVAALRDNGIKVLLWADEAVLKKRLAGNKDRPLLISRGKPMDSSGFRKLLRERTPIYFEYADIVVDADASLSKITEVIAFEASHAE
jgi:shikimate dehydrogenase